MKKKILAVVVLALIVAGVAWASSSYEVNMAQAYAGTCVDASSKNSLSVPTGASTTFSLTDENEPLIFLCRGGRCFITCDDGTPTATTSAGGYAFSVPDGGHVGPIRVGKEACAYIAVGSGVVLEVLEGGQKCY
jgi:hypothetical protein